jgi:hypothetical protein
MFDMKPLEKLLYDENMPAKNRLKIALSLGILNPLDLFTFVHRCLKETRSDVTVSADGFMVGGILYILDMLAESAVSIAVSEFKNSWKDEDIKARFSEWSHDLRSTLENAWETAYNKQFKILKELLEERRAYDQDRSGAQHTTRA